ncbi:cytochrome P450 83B1-like [Vicia villosa]|uniref:cytochrome P450 83B1-like n=1 Tax=Vicia villosa TaxID=3911 RepID=UPI00273C941B|nr:cytochrome P450 83B1-like [Vicia villosa]
MLSLYLLILCLIFPLLLFFLKRRRTIKAPHPPGPRGLPIIGNLHQLDNSIPYLQFSQLSKIYGPLFSLKRQAIVVSSAEIAKEIFNNNDLVFSNRPIVYGQQKLSYNGSEMAFSPYGDFWRDIRKLCVIHLFSAKRVSSYASIRKFEVKQMIKKISNHAASSSVTNLSEIVTSLTRYDVWVRHGEKKPKPGDLNDNNMNHEEDQIDDIGGLLHERFRDVVQEENEESVGLNEDAKKFYNLVEEAKQDLYPGCKNFSKLSFTIRLYLLKCLYGWSNVSFNALLELLREAMPSLNIPDTFNKAKGMIRDLGLDYKKIDA